MSEKIEVVPKDAAGSQQPGEIEGASAKAPYEPPRIEKRRSVARVTLLSGMGQMGVGVIM